MVISSWPWCIFPYNLVQISLSSPELLTSFRNSRWRPPPSWIFSLCEFGHSGVLIGICVLWQIRFNMCYSHWDRRTYASDFHLMTSRELTSGFDFWSPRGCDVSSHIIWCKISISSPKLLTFFRNFRWRPPPSCIFSLCEFGHSGMLIVWYLCSVLSLVQMSVIVTEIDAHSSDLHLMCHANPVSKV